MLRVENTDIEVTRKRVKRLRMRVDRSGAVKVSAPVAAPLFAIEAFVRANSAWLASARSRVEHSPTSFAPADGATVMVWGVPRTIRVERTAARSRAAYLDGDALVMPLSPAKDTAAGIERAWEAFAASEIRRVLEGGLIERMETRCGVHALGWRVRSMTSRWGSCQTAKGVVTINSRLAHFPARCLDYVVCHELCHLIEPSHNARFHALLDSFYPGWKDVAKELRS